MNEPTNERIDEVSQKFQMFLASVLTGNRDPEHRSAEREDGGGAGEGGDGGHRRDSYRRVRRCAVPVH